MRWLLTRWLQWEAVMFLWLCWHERRRLGDALYELFFGAWIESQHPEFYGLLKEGQRRAREGPNEALDDWYVVRHGSPEDRLVGLFDDPELGYAARYVHNAIANEERKGR